MNLDEIPRHSSFNLYIILDGHQMEEEERTKLELKNLKKNYKTLKEYYNPDRYIKNKEQAILQIEKLEKILIENNVQDMLDFIDQVLHTNPKFYPNYDKNITITLKELYQGWVEVFDICSQCSGSGKDKIITCTKCKGNKRLKFILFNRFNMTCQNVICDECEGEGIVGLGNNCKECNGNGKVKKILNLTDNLIPKDNIDNKIKVSNFILSYHLSYLNCKKNNLDLIYKHPISLYEMIYGFNFKINLFGIKDINVLSEDKKVYNPKHFYKVEKMGFKSGNEVGDLLIKFKVIYPSTLDEFYKR